MFFLTHKCFFSYTNVFLTHNCLRLAEGDISTAVSLYRQSGSKQLKTALKLASSGNVAELLSFLQVVLVLDVDDDDLAPQLQMCLSFSGSCRLLIAMAAKCSFYICYQLVINIYMIYQNL